MSQRALHRTALRKTALSKTLAVALLAGALCTPTAAFARSSASSDASYAALDADPVVATHATRGIVKSIDASTLVIMRIAHRGEMTFAVSPSTRLEGDIIVGSTVSVRYREEGKRHVATAVALHRSARVSR